MDFLNHLVAARLMKTAEGFERISAHGAARQLPGPSHALASNRPALGLIIDNSGGDPAHACPGDQESRRRL
jgi:hypothetical protein